MGRRPRESREPQDGLRDTERHLPHTSGHLGPPGTTGSCRSRGTRRDQSPPRRLPKLIPCRNSSIPLLCNARAGFIDLSQPGESKLQQLPLRAGSTGSDSGFGIAAALPMGWDCSSPMGWDCSSPHGLEFLLLFWGLGLFLSHGLGFLLFPLFGIPTPLPMVWNSRSFHRPCCPSPPFGSPV